MCVTNNIGSVRRFIKCVQLSKVRSIVYQGNPELPSYTKFFLHITSQTFMFERYKTIHVEIIVIVIDDE